MGALIALVVIGGFALAAWLAIVRGLQMKQLLQDCCPSGGCEPEAAGPRAKGGTQGAAERLPRS